MWWWFDISNFSVNLINLNPSDNLEARFNAVSIDLNLRYISLVHHV